MPTEWKGVLDADVVMEGVRPELDVKIGTVEHSAESIGNGKMSTFNRTVLIGAVRTGWMDLVVEFVEELENLRVSIQFPSLIHVDVFVGATWGVVG